MEVIMDQNERKAINCLIPVAAPFLHTTLGLLCTNGRCSYYTPLQKQFSRKP